MATKIEGNAVEYLLNTLRTRNPNALVNVILDKGKERFSGAYWTNIERRFMGQSPKQIADILEEYFREATPFSAESPKIGPSNSGMIAGWYTNGAESNIGLFMYKGKKIKVQVGYWIDPANGKARRGGVCKEARVEIFD